MVAVIEDHALAFRPPSPIYNLLHNRRNISRCVGYACCPGCSPNIPFNGSRGRCYKGIVRFVGGVGKSDCTVRRLASDYNKRIKAEVRIGTEGNTGRIYTSGLLRKRGSKPQPPKMKIRRTTSEILV